MSITTISCYETNLVCVFGVKLCINYVQILCKPNVFHLLKIQLVLGLNSLFKNNK